MSTDKTHMQLSISIFLLGIGFSQLFYGQLSDKYGRKPIVIFGLTLAALSNFLVFIYLNINYFLVLRLLQGIWCGVCIGVGRMIASDMVQGERYAIVTSYMSLFVSLSPLCAPAIGGYIQSWFNWQANFIVLGIIIILVLFAYILFCEETRFHEQKIS
jgi:DHA1 family bicyclomycin/chloramphenicol resistance-like MFS transporter